MSEGQRNILDRIGNTPLIALRKAGPPNGARILLKLENENPTGSMKDRMALAMIAAAEADGRLPEGGCVVEYTGGSTGVSLALVCAVKGHPLHIVTSDAFAREKLDHMRILGARLQVIPSDSGRMTEKLTRDMIAAAGSIAQETGAFWTDQMKNRDQLAAYHAMADEIWSQTGGRIDGFVQSVGTAASLRGVAEGLRRHDESIGIVAAEPAESAVLSGGPTGAHKIDGIGAGYGGAPVAGRHRRSHRAGLDRGSHGHGFPAGAGGRPLRRDVHGSQRGRRPAARRAPGAWGHDRHGDVRYGDEISEDVRGQARRGRDRPGTSPALVLRDACCAGSSAMRAAGLEQGNERADPRITHGDGRPGRGSADFSS